MIGIVLAIITSAVVVNPVLASASSAEQSSGGQPSRWESGTTSATPAVPKEAPPSAAAPAPPPPAYPPPPVTRAPTYKSDLPGGVEEAEVVPPGAVRLEDVKPGTRARPQPLNAPGAEVVPAPAPAPQPVAPQAAAPQPAYDPSLYDTRNQPATPAPGYSEPTTWYGPKKGGELAAPSRPASQPVTAAPSIGGCKSDLPGGACEHPEVPSGAVRLEDVRPGTRPKYTPPPTQEYAPPPKQATSNIKEAPVGATTGEPEEQTKAHQRWQ